MYLEGATIKIITPSLNRLIGSDSAVGGNFNIALEHLQDTSTNGLYDRSPGSLLLEDQTTDVSNTTYTRNVITYTANADVVLQSITAEVEATFIVLLIPSVLLKLRY